MSATIPENSAGWPYMNGNTYLHVLDTYTQTLATKLAALDTGGGGGVEDTGWLDCTLSSGQTADSTPPQVRVLGSVAYLRGGLKKAGFTLDTQVNGFVLPAAARPAQMTFLYAYSGSNQPPMEVIIYSGTTPVRITPRGTEMPYAYYFDTCSWLVG